MLNKLKTKTLHIVIMLMIINIILTINPKLSAAQNPTPFLSSPYYGSYDVSQRYSAGHSGIDFLLAFNPVLAAAEGWQEVAEWDEPSCHDDEQPFCGSAAGLGLYVRIRHDDQIAFGEHYYTYYGHLSSARELIERRAKQGKWIGQSGKSGYTTGTTGRHLHFEVTHGGTEIGPNGDDVNPDNHSGVSLWQDGEWVENLPDGNPDYAFPTFSFSDEIVVENSAAGFSTNCGVPPCSWNYETNSGYAGDYYWSQDTNNTDYGFIATWEPNVHSFGYYRVRAWIPCTTFTGYEHGGASWQAPYLVHHYYAETPVIVDQLTLTKVGAVPSSPDCDRWVALGGYVSNNAGSGEMDVELTIDTGETAYARNVIADAIKFVSAHIGPIEAEDYRFKTERSNHSWDLQGNGSLRAMPNNGTNISSDYETTSPELEYRVVFPTKGAWYIWVCGKGNSSGDDSLHAGFNGVAQSTAKRITCNPEWRNGNWAWCSINDDSSGDPRRYLTVNVPGLHTVNLWMREDGFYVDRVLLSQDATYTPPASDCSP